MRRFRTLRPSVGPITDARELYDALDASDSIEAEIEVSIPNRELPKRGRYKWKHRRHKCWSSSCHRGRQKFCLDGEFHSAQESIGPDLSRGLIFLPSPAAVARLRRASAGECFCGYDSEPVESMLARVFGYTDDRLMTHCLSESLTEAENTGIYFAPHSKAEPMKVAVELDTSLRFVVKDYAVIRVAAPAEALPLLLAR